MYVGKTIRTIQRRFSCHVATALQQKPQHSHIRLYSAMRKYGIENFVVEEIDVASTSDELDEKEKYWIKRLHTFIDDPECNGYNMTIGGEGGPFSAEVNARRTATKLANGTFKHTEETKRKLSIANKNKPKSAVHKQHLSEHHHLKKTHILYYQDGHTEISTDSVCKLGQRMGVHTIQLCRASQIGEFRCGEFFLLDLINYEEAFRHKYRFSKEQIVIDPVSGSAISLTGLRGKYQRYPELYDYQYPAYQFSPEYRKKFENFKNQLETIKCNALHNNKINIIEEKIK